MENTTVILLSIGLFILLLAVILTFRFKLGDKFEVKNTDIVLALLPIVIWLLLSGKITSMQFGDLKFETAFKKAKNETVVNQVYQLPITTISGDYKQGLDKIDQLLLSKPQALKFVIGKESYVPWMVAEYMRRFEGSTVKYIIFENSSNQFVAITTLRELRGQMTTQGSSPDRTSSNLVQWLATGDTSKLNTVRGILSGQLTVSEGTSKQVALDMMEKANSEYLPVIGKDKTLLGVVERSRLTASLLLDVSRSLDK